MLVPAQQSGEPGLRRTAASECPGCGVPSLVFGRFYLPITFVTDVFLTIAALSLKYASCLPAAAERAVELHEGKRFALLRVDQVQLGSKKI